MSQVRTDPVQMEVQTLEQNLDRLNLAAADAKQAKATYSFSYKYPEFSKEFQVSLTHSHSAVSLTHSRSAVSLTHSHTLTITCTCCCDEIKGIQDQDIFSSHSLILSLL